MVYYPIDQTLNQSLEFLETGIVYYNYSNFIDNFKYVLAAIFHQKEKYLHYYKYEDITKVTLSVKKRAENYGKPIARALYIIDYYFEFNNGTNFYFYYPLTLDDDSKFIGYILEDKVKNIEDKDNVLFALKNGINITDYMNANPKS